MSDYDTQITAIEQVTATPLDVGESRPSGSTDSPWRKVHRVLRGRYHWAILLGIIGATLAGFAGWSTKVPVYRSEGLIYIAPTMPSLEDPAERHVLPGFNGFVAFQVQILNSRQTTLMAMEMDAWGDATAGSPPSTPERFERRRSVLHRHGTQHLLVHFVDPDPEVAAAGVQSLIQAYLVQSAEVARPEDAEQLQASLRKIETLNERIRVDTEEINALTAKDGGVTTMEMRQQKAVEQLGDVEAELAQLESMLKSYERQEEPEEEEAPDPGEPLSALEIAVEDPALAGSLRELSRLQAQEKRLAARLGPKSDRLVAIRDEIQSLEEWISQYVEVKNRSRSTGSMHVDGERVSYAELSVRASGLRARQTELEERSVTIGDALMKVRRLQSGIDDMNRKVDQLQRLIDRLQAERVGKGRITIQESGTRPTSPFTDPRRKFAVLLGFLGGMLGFGIVALFGIRDRRLKGAADIEQDLGQLRLLGVLPELPQDLSEPEGGELAVHCVHHIRTLLQIGMEPNRSTCVCLTGPGTASGKTTLATALGLSFGKSNSRTLLIDGDLVGRGLTWRVTQMLLSRARQVAGEIEYAAARGEDASPAAGPTRPLLERFASPMSAPDLPNPADLRELLARCVNEVGLRAARDSGIVDDLFALADLLYPGEGRDLLALQLMSLVASEGGITSGSPSEWIPPQVLEFEPGRGEFNGSPVSRYLYRTGLDAVRFLPLRGLGRQGEISVATVSGILARVRDEFDVVVVDTGPVPGSNETSIVAAHADAVVLVVSQGDHRPDLERTVSHLDQLGAKIAGVVFNRAEHRDVMRARLSRSSVPSGG